AAVVAPGDIASGGALQHPDGERVAADDAERGETEADERGGDGRRGEVDSEDEREDAETHRQEAEECQDGLPEADGDPRDSDGGEHHDEGSRPTDGSGERLDHPPILTS